MVEHVVRRREGVMAKIYFSDYNRSVDSDAMLAMNVKMPTTHYLTNEQAQLSHRTERRQCCGAFFSAGNTGDVSQDSRSHTRSNACNRIKLQSMALLS